jgi:hypothetical protein
VCRVCGREGHADGACQEKPTAVIDGVEFYGKILGEVRPEEVEGLEPTPTSELHLGRHWNSLPESYTSALVGKEYEYYDQASKSVQKVQITPEKIAASFNVKGSKFYDNVSGLENPARLIAFVREEATRRAQDGSLKWFDVGYGKRTVFTVELPEEIGRDGLVSLSDLSEGELAQLEQQPRGKLQGDDFKVNVIKGHPGKPTRKISVMIGIMKGETKPVVFAAFPGENAPPFPTDQQGFAEREYGKRFWEQHAFIA